MANNARFVRLAIALVLLVLFVIGFLAGAFVACTEVVRADVVVRTCRPPTISDAAVLATAALVFALVWPDLGRLDLFGISLRRQVDEATARAREADIKASQALNASFTNSPTFTNHTTVITPTDSLHLQALSGAQGATSAPPSVDLTHVHLMGERYAMEAFELIYKWEELLESLGISSADFLPRRFRGKGRLEQRDYEYESFTSGQRESLAAIRKVRNAVAHGGKVARDDLRNALSLTTELLARYRNHTGDHDF
jgi:hypothetical protein